MQVHIGVVQGYTALELLLVAGLVSSLLLAGAPAMTQLAASQELRAEARLLLADVRQARMNAISSGTDVTFQWTPELYSKLSVYTAFGGRQGVTFTGRSGMAGFSSGRFQMTHSQLPRARVDIVVSSLGRVRWCQPQRELPGVPLCA